MTTLLFSVGIIVFFVTVCGAVMAGGHLLAEAEMTETSITPARLRAEDAELGDTLRNDARLTGASRDRDVGAPALAGSP